VPLVFEEPAMFALPPLLAPASLPLLPPPDLPALPACEGVPAVAPQVAVALQSSDELLQAESWTALKPRTSASAEKAEIRI
jgi:hypothetical protein